MPGKQPYSKNKCLSVYRENMVRLFGFVYVLHWLCLRVTLVTFTRCLLHLRIMFVVFTRYAAAFTHYVCSVYVEL